ncbi:MAG: ribbon-helix-helix protein, CopG family, partial [Chlorobaculum sp.]|nr:ribbon-helix-helix protein, CopG family [Chlorobaculum sp.]
MSDLYRFGISLDRELIEAFDRHIKAQGYQSRSEALRDLIREELLRKTTTEGGLVAGAIVMTYDHHKRELVNR